MVSQRKQETDTDSKLLTTTSKQFIMRRFLLVRRKRKAKKFQELQPHLLNLACTSCRLKHPAPLAWW